MSATPRTDAVEYEHHQTQAGSRMRKRKDGGWVESDFARELELENARLKREIEWLQLNNDMLSDEPEANERAKRELAELRADKERLDWLESDLYTLWACGLRCNEAPLVEIAASSGRFEADSIRAAIDAARKEAKP